MPIPQPVPMAPTLPDIAEAPSRGTPIDLLAGLESGLLTYVDWADDQMALVDVSLSDHVHIPSDLVELRALDLNTGKVLWRVPASAFPLEEPAFSSAQVLGHTAILTVHDSGPNAGGFSLFGLDLATGQLASSRIPLVDRDADYEVVDGVLVVYDQTNVTGYDPTTFAQLWQQPSNKDVTWMYDGDRGVIGGSWVFTGAGYVVAKDGTPTGLGTEPVSCAYYQQTADGSLFRVSYVRQAVSDFGPWWDEFYFWLWDAATQTSPWAAPLVADAPDIAAADGTVYVFSGHTNQPLQLVAAGLATGAFKWGQPVTAGGADCTFLCDAAHIRAIEDGYVFGDSIASADFTMAQYAASIDGSGVQDLGDTTLDLMEFGPSVMYTDAGGALTAYQLDDALTQLWSLPLATGEDPIAVGSHFAIVAHDSTLTLLS